MNKYVEVAYRPIDIPMPKIVQEFFEYIQPELRCPVYGITENGQILRGIRSENVHNINASLCGGMPRDLLLGLPYNDLDIVCPIEVSSLYYKVGNKLKHLDDDDTHPHDLFESGSDCIKVHWIEQYTAITDNMPTDCVVTPGVFDFTINEIHMSNKGQWYASPISWFDFDNRILRMNAGRRVTSTIAIRTIRLAAKCGLKIEENTLRSVMYKFQKNFINEKVILKQLKKIQNDHTEDIAFYWLTKAGYPKIHEYRDLPDMIDKIDFRVEEGTYISNEEENVPYNEE